MNAANSQLIFRHGAGERASVWDDVIAGLPADWSCDAIDLGELDALILSGGQVRPPKWMMCLQWQISIRLTERAFAAYDSTKSETLAMYAAGTAVIRRRSQRTCANSSLPRRYARRGAGDIRSPAPRRRRWIADRSDSDVLGLRVRRPAPVRRRDGRR